MSQSSIGIDSNLQNYIVNNSSPLPDKVHGILAQANEIGLGNYPVSPEQAQFLRFFVKAINAKSAIEIGTFLGTSLVAIAAGLSSGSRFISCDINKEYSIRARDNYKGMRDDIGVDIINIDGVEYMREMARDEAFDFVFIDAGFESIEELLELSMRRVRIGGTIAIDNALRKGRVADQDVRTNDAVIMRKINETASQHKDFVSSLTPIGDGTLLLNRMA
jgi:predicted O-methyltransferase YrrM